ncbi:unnamed protein product, partial [Staurois parvus]
MDRICGLSIMDRTWETHLADTPPMDPSCRVVGLLNNLPFCGAGPVSPHAVGVTWCGPHIPHLPRDATE